MKKIKFTPEDERELEELLLKEKEIKISDEIDDKIAGMNIPGDAIQTVMKSFKTEDEFISKYRPRCLIVLLTIICLSIAGIIALITYNVFIKIDTIALIAALTTLLVETLGLLNIVFKYLFNRSENKVLDIVSNIIKEIITIKKK